MNVYGWSNGGYSDNSENPKIGTHDWIVEKAVDLLPSNEAQIFKDHMTSLKYGTEFPDRPASEGGIGDTFNHHVYFDEQYRVFDDSAALRANETYYQAINLLEQGNLTDGTILAGSVSHYVSDLAVWGHIMGEDTPWGKEQHHQDYENYVNEHLFLFQESIILLEPLNRTSAYQATLDLASDTMFREPNATWMDENYDWNNETFKTRVGESLNLAVNYVANILHTLWLDAMQDYCRITFNTEPANTGTITFDAVTYSDEDFVWKLAGSYNITANPGSYGFSGWTTVGNISIINTNSISSSCTISGNGILKILQVQSSPQPTPPSGCIIVTASYGEETDPQVIFMRNVRDNMIGSNPIGKSLVNGWNIFYYSWSPPVANLISNSEEIQAISRILIFPLIIAGYSTAFVYSIITPISPVIASVFAFSVGVFLGSLFYIILPMMVLLTIFRKRIRQLSNYISNLR